MPTRVKICGITRPGDAALAAEYGADFIGLNFFQGPRKIDIEPANLIIDATPRFLPIVALQSWPGPGTYFPALDQDRVNRLSIRQFYGLWENLISLPSSFFANCPVKELTASWIPIQVHSRNSITDIKNAMKRISTKLEALLLDTASPKLGGTGQSFNWKWIAEAREAGELEGLPPLILAGGLTPDNVAEAIRVARPYAVDVSSGVEVAGKPGIKDAIKMRDFIQAAKSAL